MRRLIGISGGRRRRRSGLWCARSGNSALQNSQSERCVRTSAATFRETFSARYDSKVDDAGHVAVFRNVSCTRELFKWPYRPFTPTKRRIYKQFQSSTEVFLSVSQVYSQCKNLLLVI